LFRVKFARFCDLARVFEADVPSGAFYNKVNTPFGVCLAEKSYKWAILRHSGSQEIKEMTGQVFILQRFAFKWRLIMQ